MPFSKMLKIEFNACARTLKLAMALKIILNIWYLQGLAKSEEVSENINSNNNAGTTTCNEVNNVGL